MICDSEIEKVRNLMRNLSRSPRGTVLNVEYGEDPAVFSAVVLDSTTLAWRASSAIYPEWKTGTPKEAIASFVEERDLHLDTEFYGEEAYGA